MDDWNEVRAKAKSLGIVAHGKKRAQLEEEIAQKERWIPSAEDGMPDEAPVKIGADRTATDRATEIRKMRKQSGIEIGGRQLNLPPVKKEPGYWYRWVIDTKGRILDFEKRGYQLVEGVEPVSAGSSTPNKLYLMQIPLEIYEEDQKEKESELKAVESSLKRGETTAGGKVEDDRLYGEVSIERA